MLNEDIQLRAFQSLKVDRNHMKLDLNELSPLDKLESVCKSSKNKIRFLKILFDFTDNSSSLFSSSFWLLHIFDNFECSIYL